ncbi:hypothetical protein BDN72DRAFT_810153 [Pluteus cervinus]|uniref:Uncharacterized protein n=1 Tax=Pluteus cervinus TaxID=181527 RepID=A0ACD3BDG7_9AGAR|nr:hypothetical protein BDN72DRAFT_810153 [Pluteus cervinus]
MAKSTRSKVKRSFRSKKRQEGIYAATEAARLQRLNAKLLAVASNPGEVGQEDTSAQELDTPADDAETMAVDPHPSSSKPISTHGPRNSGREQWRASKGLVPRPKSQGMNRQGGVAARRKAGRSKRRR